MAVPARNLSLDRADILRWLTLVIFERALAKAFSFGVPFYPPRRIDFIRSWTT
jgi:hypothetical protein